MAKGQFLVKNQFLPEKLWIWMAKSHCEVKDLNSRKPWTCFLTYVFLTFPLLFLLLIILFLFLFYFLFFIILFLFLSFFILHFSLLFLHHIWSGINTSSMKFKWPKANFWSKTKFYQRNFEYGWLKATVRSKT